MVRPKVLGTWYAWRRIALDAQLIVGLNGVAGCRGTGIKRWEAAHLKECQVGHRLPVSVCCQTLIVALAVRGRITDIDCAECAVWNADARHRQGRAVLHPRVSVGNERQAM